MSTERAAPSTPTADGELSEVLAAYLDAIDRGAQPDRAALLARHPHLFEQLQTYFSNQDRLDQLAGPLRVEGEVEATFLAYEFLEEIGRGGMGVVLRCRDSALDRDLAVKVLLDRYRDRPDLVRRFIEEARITGRLQHPFIVPVHELGSLPDGRPYFAMKLVQGRTLAELLQGRLTPAEDQQRYLQIFAQICQTTAYAHSKGVIHRDLKPANVMVGTFGEVQVMDWGLAKALVEAPAAGAMNFGVDASSAEGDAAAGPDTEAGSILGTFAYMPPEQARGELQFVNRRSDVFGLGAILCEILTGSPAYAGEPAEVREKGRAGRTDEALARLEACGADAALIELAKKCLAVEPAARPDDGAAVADAMARHFAAVQERLRSAEIARARAETEAVEERKRMVLAEAKADAEQKRGTAERKRRRATVLMAASFVLLLAAGAGFGLWYREAESTREAEVAARRAVTERDVATALTEVRLRHDEAMKHADNPERWKLTLTGARDAVMRAENALAVGVSAEMLRDEVNRARELIDQDERDQRLFATLERIWLEGIVVGVGEIVRPRTDLLMLKAFREYGLDLEALEPRQAAASIRAHPHCERLVNEIGLAAHMQALHGSNKQHQSDSNGVNVRVGDWRKSEKLCLVLDEVDANPAALGTRWRAARAKPDRAALVKMAQSAEARSLAPRAVLLLFHDLYGVEAFAEARTLLSETLERYPTDFSLNLNLGFAYWASKASGNGGTLDDAVSHLKAAMAARGSSSTAIQILLSRLYQDQGKLDQALHAAELAVAANAKSAGPHCELGERYYERRDWDRALASFQQAALCDKTSPVPPNWLGQTYAAKNDYAKAIAHFRIAIENDPSDASAHVHVGVALLAMNDLDGAVKQLEKSIRLFPEYAGAHLNLGVALNLKNDPRARDCFQTALKYDPRDRNARSQLGHWYLARGGNAEEAIRCYQGGVDVNPKRAEGHFALADLLQGLGRHGQAEPSLRKVIEIDPRFPEAQLGLGISLAAQNKFDDAIHCYRTALEQNGDTRTQAILHNYIGVAYSRRGDFDEAAKSYRQALAVDRVSDGSANFTFNLGIAQLGKGDVEDAALSFGTALVRNPKDEKYHVYLARALLELHDLKGALASARTARDLASNIGEAYHFLAVAQWELGDYVGGLETARKGQSVISPASSNQRLLRRDAQLCEQYVNLDKLLPAVLNGQAKPANAKDGAILGVICGCKHQRYVAASRLFAEAFSGLPHPVGDDTRFKAACCAARGGTGDAEQDAIADAAARRQLRLQSLDWLRADLDGWKTVMKFGSRAEKGKARFRFRCWLREPALAKVRQPQVLQEAADDERQAWADFWADVRAHASNADPAKT